MGFSGLLDVNSVPNRRAGSLINFHLHADFHGVKKISSLHHYYWIFFRNSNLLGVQTESGAS